ncbi:8-amino-7-oxononanoate synthase [Acetivibrio saccincola]|uniref:8-amino-7-ketopelargonate synthase n=1 Tax=Acetivibrio saccincola TaxID=1677857 RepID=A0A2S8RCN5_9FIRM|nr:8-amino-7-oxononanoate synthase [Acetivibrio saccincola]PQQ67549.1 8-amino-7-oxononanoate synthase [Acetivibrio saccincola]
MEYINEILSNLKKNNKYRGEFKKLQSPQKEKVVIDGREIILLGSNNYLGLCDHKEVKKASMEAIEKYGVGAGGSRLTTGSYTLHSMLEEKIKDIKGTQKALVFNTGYMANLGIIQALCNKDWVIFCDKYNHASILDGCLLSGAKFLRYRHCDMDDLSYKLENFKGKCNLIVTDGVFSMDGDIAPLDKIVEISKKHNAVIMVDDAHGFGVLGIDGAGTASYFGVNSEIHIHMGTLSKAVGSIGGYAASEEYFIEYFKNFSRSFIFSTALPPSSVAASIKALDIIKNEPLRRQRLLENSHRFKMELKNLGFKIPDTVTPIIPVIVGDEEKTLEFSRQLLYDRIYIPAIRPPTVPKGSSRLRISITAAHAWEDLEYVIERLKTTGRKLGLI